VPACCACCSQVWSLTNCKLRNNLVGHQGYVNTVTVSPDGSLCASGGKVRAEALGAGCWAGLAWRFAGDRRPAPGASARVIPSFLPPYPIPSLAHRDPPALASLGFLPLPAGRRGDAVGPV
jgi:hypothetical protein